MLWDILSNLLYSCYTFLSSLFNVILPILAWTLPLLTQVAIYLVILPLCCCITLLPDVRRDILCRILPYLLRQLHRDGISELSWCTNVQELAEQVQNAQRKQQEEQSKIGDKGKADRDKQAGNAPKIDTSDPVPLSRTKSGNSDIQSNAQLSPTAQSSSITPKAGDGGVVKLHERRSQ